MKWEDVKICMQNYGMQQFLPSSIHCSNALSPALKRTLVRFLCKIIDTKNITESGIVLVHFISLCVRCSVLEDCVKKNGGCVVLRLHVHVFVYASFPTSLDHLSNATRRSLSSHTPLRLIRLIPFWRGEREEEEEAQLCVSGGWVWGTAFGDDTYARWSALEGWIHFNGGGNDDEEIFSRFQRTANHFPRSGVVVLCVEGVWEFCMHFRFVVVRMLKNVCMYVVFVESQRERRWRNLRLMRQHTFCEREKSEIYLRASPSSNHIEIQRISFHTHTHTQHMCMSAVE